MMVFHRAGNVMLEEGNDWGVNRFPDGQNQFWMLREWVDRCGWNLDVSIRNPEELDLFIQVISTMRLDSIQINYLYGARCDKWDAGERRVANMHLILYSQIANSELNVDTPVYVVMPHGGEPWPSIVPLHPALANNVPSYDLILFPDESAMGRFKGEFHGIAKRTCRKTRDQVSGNITQHVMPDDIGDFRRILVADDLCDGGRTFLDIATEANKRPGNAEGNRLDLYVAHGVFSNGALPKLMAHFDRIYTTDSYQDHAPTPVMEVLSVWRMR